MKEHLPPTSRTLGAGPWRWPGRPPLRIWIWTAAALALGMVLVLLWLVSDARATSSTTGPRPPAATGVPGSALAQAWSAPGDPVPQQVVQGGRVIVGSRHGLTALDPSTGREAWHYLRSNAQLCGLTATDGVAVAVFREGTSLCDQAVALEADTGVRAWNRNVDFLPGVRLISTAGHVLAVAPRGVVDLDPLGSNIRWRYDSPRGCRLLDARTGTTGTALLQQCHGTPTLQLRLMDGITGEPHWTQDVQVPDGGQVRLAGADWLVTLVVGDQLQVRAAADGTQQQSIALPSGGTDGVPAETTASGSVIVWTHGTALFLDHETGALRWQGPAVGLPGMQVGRSAANSAVLVPEDGAFVTRDANSGTEQGRSTVGGLPTGGSATAVGSTVVYRLPDRVLGYR